MATKSGALISFPLEADGHGNASGNGNGSPFLSPRTNLTINILSKTQIVEQKRSLDTTTVLLAAGTLLVGGTAVAVCMKRPKEQSDKQAQPTLASQLMGSARRR
ncbi:hypothetical protein V8E51_013896 [Hyaloscypha variabilis]